MRSRKGFAQLGDVVLQEVCDLQPTDECEYRYLLTTIEDHSELALEEINVGFEVVSLPHLDGEEVVTTHFGFLANGVLCEEGLGDL